MRTSTGWYVKRYTAKGTFVHVVGPKGDVLTMTTEEARTLGAALIEEGQEGGTRYGSA